MQNDNADHDMENLVYHDDSSKVSASSRHFNI